MVYAPAEDSYLLAKEIKKYFANIKNKKNLRVLDMGSGSGIQAETCFKLGISKQNILCVDIDKEVITLLKQKGFKAIRGNLFSKINKKSKFNLITFNPPYLPEDEYDKGIDTTAGKEGFEIILSFLNQARDFLDKEGEILLLVSSLSKPDIIKKEAKKLGFAVEMLSEEKLFFEKLFVWGLRLS